MSNFPEKFLWGSATSAYQVEGNINNSDWSKCFPAGKACDFYNKYQEDFVLLEKLNQNAHRLSIEWSRIQLQENTFNEQEIDHYRNVLQSLKQKGIKTMVTLHHYTNPLWFTRKKGWLSYRNSLKFVDFAQKMAQEYHGLVDFWVTVNEPSTYAAKAFLEGSRPPFKKNIISFVRVVKNQIKIHKKVYQELHKNHPGIKIGVAKELNFFEPFNEKYFWDKLFIKLANYLWNDYFLIKTKKHLDFIGLNYYFHNKIKFLRRYKDNTKEKSDLNWEISPQGIYYVLLRLKEYNLPIYVTENGLADKQDKQRKEFIKNHLFWIKKAIDKGVDVRGYFHWSLMDNFEWEQGFEPRFGLVEIDYSDFSRKIRPSGYYYADICKNNKLI